MQDACKINFNSYCLVSLLKQEAVVTWSACMLFSATRQIFVDIPEEFPV